MTYSTNGKSTSNLTAYHKEEGAIVTVVVGSSNIDLDREQREALAAYLLKENN